MNDVQWCFISAQQAQRRGFPFYSHRGYVECSGVLLDGRPFSIKTWVNSDGICAALTVLTTALCRKSVTQ